MRRMWFVMFTGLLIVALVASLVGPTARANAGADDPKAIVQKAIDARGGEQKLAAYKTTTCKGTCTFYSNGRGIHCTGEWAEQLPDNLKASYVMDVGGRKMTRVEIVTPNAGWTVMGGKLRAASAEHLADVHDGFETVYAATLLFPLKGPAYQLSSAGEAKIDGRAAVGVKVVHKEDGQRHREFTLYLDKEHGDLLELQIRVKGIDGHDVDQDTVFSGYRDFDGVRSFSKSVTKREGKIFLETEITEFKTPERLPPHTFDKPETPSPQGRAATAK